MSGFQFSSFPPRLVPAGDPPRVDAPSAATATALRASSVSSRFPTKLPLCPALGHFRTGMPPSSDDHFLPPCGDCGASSVESRSPQVHNSLYTIKNAVKIRQIPDQNARESSVLFRSRWPNRRATSKGLLILKLSGQKSECSCCSSPGRRFEPVPGSHFIFLHLRPTLDGIKVTIRPIVTGSPALAFSTNGPSAISPCPGIP